MVEKTYRADVLIDKYFLRSVAAPLARLLSKTIITPNQVTFLGFLLSLVASYLFLQGSYPYIIVGAFFGWFSGMLDYADGTLARIKKKESYFGAWLDGIFDRISEAILLTAIAIGIFNSTGNVGIYLILIGAVFMVFMHSYLNCSMLALYEHKLIKTTSKEKGTKRSILEFFTYGRSVFILAMTVGMLFNLGYWLLFGFATLGNIYILIVFVSNIKKFRKSEKEGLVDKCDTTASHKRMGLQ